MTPKGLRLSRQIHPIPGTESGETRAKIDSIIHGAERGILRALIDHYDSLVESPTHQLQVIEENLKQNRVRTVRR